MRLSQTVLWSLRDWLCWGRVEVLLRPRKFLIQPLKSSMLLLRPCVDGTRLLCVAFGIIPGLGKRFIEIGPQKGSKLLQCPRLEFNIVIIHLSATPLS